VAADDGQNPRLSLGAIDHARHVLSIAANDVHGFGLGHGGVADDGTMQPTGERREPEGERDCLAEEFAASGEPFQDVRHVLLSEVVVKVRLRDNFERHVPMTRAANRL